MHSATYTWSRFAYIGALVLALVLFIPTTGFPLQVGKVAIFALLTAGSMLLFVWGGGVRALARAHGFGAALLVGLLPVVYGLSALFSTDKSIALLGHSLDVDTVLFTALAFVAFILAFVHFRTLRTLRLLVLSLGGALVLAAIFQYVSIFFGAPIPGVDDRSVNLVGKWNDLGLLVGLLALLLLSHIQLGYIAGGIRAAATAGLFALLALLAFINFSLVWALLLCGALVVGAIGYLSARGEGGMPILSAITVALAGLFLIFGATFNTTLTNIFPVSSLEVRPSAGTTFDIISHSYNGSLPRFLIGMGPNTFAQHWMLHKPAEVNQSQFWSLDFNVGFSTLTTALLSVGVLGLLAWLLPLFLVLAGVVRAIRSSVLTSEDRGAAVSIALAALFAYAALAFYVPSPNLILLAFILSGAAFGFLWRQGKGPRDEAPMRRIEQIMVLSVVVVLVVASMWAAFVGVRRLTSSIYLAQGQVALAAGNSADALAAASASGNVEETPASLRLAVDARVLKLSELAQAPTPSSALQAEFADVARDTLALSTRAIERAPLDYRSYVSAGAAYLLLASLRVDGAYESARSAYEKAIERNPTNPALPLLAARLEVTEGNMGRAKELLDQSLTLKPNYTSAMLFGVQLAVSQNDLPSAVRAAQSAAESAPGVASIWFQLGLLHYASGNMNQAITPLERAIALEPEYANAKYFLGIAYYDQNRKNEAMALFEDLQRTNPGEREVALILANMRADRPALEGISAGAVDEAPVAE